MTGLLAEDHRSPGPSLPQCPRSPCLSRSLPSTPLPVSPNLRSSGPGSHRVSHLGEHCLMVPEASLAAGAPHVVSPFSRGHLAGG